MQISLAVVPLGPLHNMSSLFQEMAWHQAADKPLSKPMMTQFTDACSCTSLVASFTKEVNLW